MKKVSTLMAATMLTALLLPVVASASVNFFFDYNVSHNKLIGSVYAPEHSDVKVQIKGSDGKLVEIMGNTSPYVGNYDDKNTQYMSTDFSMDANSAPECIKITNNNNSYAVDAWDAPWSDDYKLYHYYSVVTDSYRIEGKQYFSDYLNGHALGQGSELFRFTPVVGSDWTDMDGIEVVFPYYGDIGTTLDYELINASDFALKDVTGGKDIGIKDLLIKPSGIWPSLILQFDAPLATEHEYLLSLSDNSKDNSINFPNINEDGQIFFARLYVGKVIGSEWKPLELARFDSVLTDENSTVLGENDTLPVYDYGELTTCQDNSVTPTPSIGTTPPPTDGKQSIDENALKNPKEGKVGVTLAEDKKEVTLPTSASTALGNNLLELHNNKFSIEIPSEVIKQLEGLITADDLKTANISFKFEPVNQKVLETLLGQSGIGNNESVKSAGEVYEFQISIVTKDGKEIKLTKLDKPLTLKLKVDASSNQNLLGVYYVADDGKIEYVGGELVNGEITVNINHFSKYAVLEYNKMFADVPNDHWASEAIKILSAKHIVSGISQNEFAPSKNTTRAEFASLLVKALNLKAAGSPKFKDVAADKWYSSAVAAASEAGIINGRSGDVFAPNDVITREEMATMIIKAFEYKTGKKASTAEGNTFADASQVTSWAKPYVEAAVELGLLKGKNGKFAPKSNATRAECAQVILNLIVQ